MGKFLLNNYLEVEPWITRPGQPAPLLNPAGLLPMSKARNLWAEVFLSLFPTVSGSCDILQKPVSM